MKRTLISTLHFYNNFGSVLQAYALCRVLQRLTGGQVDILSYRPNLPEYEYFHDPVLQQEYQRKCDKFENFRREYLEMLQGVDSNLHEEGRLAEAMADYDTFVVGSDIVWGREFSGLDPVYFLRGIPKGGIRIAYGASVLLSKDGRTEDDRLFEAWLPDFDFIAVRETSSVGAIQHFTQKKVVDVLDPTLLLSQCDYDSLVVEDEDTKREPYLLSYFLTHDPAVVDYTNMVAMKLGLRVVHYFADYPDRVFPKDAKCFAFAGPREFLGYVKNASCIFTNSFHGTCFSMIYRKPFYTYMGKRAMLSRVRDTVTRLGMEDRFFSDFLDLSKVSMEIDYGGMERRLAEEKSKSLEFLRDSLEWRG